MSINKIEYILVTSVCLNKGALELYEIEMIFKHEFQEKTVLHLVMVEIHRDNLICNTFLNSCDFPMSFVYQNATLGGREW